MADTGASHEDLAVVGGAAGAADGQGHGDHGATTGHDVGHAQEPLGPVDWRAWGAACLGAVGAVVTALALYAASHP